jgi:hypothetical protein
MPQTLWAAACRCRSRQRLVDGLPSWFGTWFGTFPCSVTVWVAHRCVLRWSMLKQPKAYPEMVAPIA